MLRLPFDGMANTSFAYSQCEKPEIGGYYPVGAYSTWHGGIHFNNIKPVYPLCSGEIIAYRLSEDYESIVLTEKISLTRYNALSTEMKEYYEKDQEGDPDLEEKYKVKSDYKNEKKIQFSNNFILMRHKLLIDKKDSKNPENSELTFYTLYMHLLPDKYYGLSSVQDYVSIKNLKCKHSPFYRDWLFKINTKKDSIYIEAKDISGEEVKLLPQQIVEVIDRSCFMGKDTSRSYLQVMAKRNHKASKYEEMSVEAKHLYYLPGKNDLWAKLYKASTPLLNDKYIIGNGILGKSGVFVDFMDKNHEMASDYIKIKFNSPSSNISCKKMKGYISSDALDQYPGYKSSYKKLITDTLMYKLEKIKDLKDIKKSFRITTYSALISYKQMVNESFQPEISSQKYVKSFGFAYDKELKESMINPKEYIIVIDKNLGRDDLVFISNKC